MAVRAYNQALSLAKKHNQSTEAAKISQQLDYIYKEDKDLKDFAEKHFVASDFKATEVASMGVPFYHC